jgi:SAM-dependent methyltransferase
MEKIEYQAHFELEERYWWFRARRKLAFRLLRRALRGKDGLRILDAGCGTGINLSGLARFGSAFGFDFAPEALAFCRRRGLPDLAQADANRLPCQDESFDLVTFFDVLYHQGISDDAALAEAARVLKSGGLILITDSALEILRGPHDEAMQGARRYDKKGLQVKLDGAGFEVIRIGYFFMTTFPAVYLKRRWERRQAARHPGTAPHSDLPSSPGRLNGFMAGLLSIEAALAARWNLPIGSSIVALARKK